MPYRKAIGSAVLQPSTDLVSANPDAGLCELWLPSYTKRGLVRNIMPSISDGAYVPKAAFGGSIPGGVGWNPTSLTRQYSFNRLSGASRYAWAVVAYRDSSASSTYSVVRCIPQLTPIQEAANTVRALVWSGAVRQENNYNAGASYTTYSGRINVFAGRSNGSALNIYANGGAPTVVTGTIAPLDSATSPFCIGGAENNTEIATPWTILAVAVWRDNIPSEAQLYAYQLNPWSLFAQPARRRISSGVSGGTTVALTGVSGTGSVGSLAASVSIALTGNAATGSVGSLTPSTGVVIALTGNEGTGSVGSLAPSVSIALSGNAVTGSVGDLTPVSGVIVALTGNSATGSVGSLAPSISIALTGVSGTGSVGSVVVGGLSSAKVGGDDVPRRKSPEKGFDLKAWKKKQELWDDVEETIKGEYAALIGEAKVEALKVVSPHIETGKPNLPEQPAFVIDWAAVARDSEVSAKLKELKRIQDEEKMIVEWLFND